MKANRDSGAGMDRLLRAALGAKGRQQAEACPDAGDLAAFVEGALSKTERRGVERHIASCGRCQEALATMVDALPARDVGVGWAGIRLPRVSLRWLAPAAAVVTVALVYLVVRPSLPGYRQAALDEVGAGPAAVTQAVGEARPTAPSAPVPPTASPGTRPTASLEGRAERPESRDVRARQAAKGRAADASGERAAAGAAAVRAEATAAPVAVDQVKPQVQAQNETPPARPADKPARTVSETVVVTAETPTLKTQAAFVSATPPPNAVGGVAPARAGVLAEPTGAPGRAGAAPGVVLVAVPGAPVRWRLEPGGVIWRSPDGGTSWERQQSGTAADLLAGSATNPTTCWVVGRGGTVLRTADGSEWQVCAFPEGADLVQVVARDALTATVITRDGRPFTTRDGGVTWVAGR